MLWRFHVEKGLIWLHPAKYVVLCCCRIPRMHLLQVFVHICYCVCMCTSKSQCRWVVPFKIPRGAHVSCLSLCCKPKDIKDGACFPLCLSFSFGGWPCFWMPIWSAAVPEPLLSFPFPCPFSPCIGVFQRVAPSFSPSSSLSLLMKWHLVVFWTPSYGLDTEGMLHIGFPRLPGFEWSINSCLDELYLWVMDCL